MREAYARFLVDRDKEQHQRSITKKKAVEAKNSVTVLTVCQAYLSHAKSTGKPKTHHDRADTLFDFCFGLPPEFRNKKDNEPQKLTAEQEKKAAALRIHDGYGKMLVADLLPIHIDQWLDAHPTWNGGRRSRIQAVKRALNYTAEKGLIAENPIVGYSTPRAKSRVTYLTEEQERALLELAKPQLATAIRVCIRTGARPGVEFAALESRHVSIDDEGRMEWTFEANESKTGKLRVLRIKDKEIIRIVEEQIAKNPTGLIFRNTRGNPWNQKSLSIGFCTLKEKLKAEGVQLDPDACMYSCRHTYAKRTLQGFWTGKMINVDTLAGLMGNSPPGLP